jgi:hypothetical protein
MASSLWPLILFSVIFCCFVYPTLGMTLARPIVIAQVSGSSLDSRRRHDHFISFFAGGLAGTLSCSLTIPLEVVKMQLQSSTISARRGAADVCKQIWQREGIKVCYMSAPHLLC